MGVPSVIIQVIPFEHRSIHDDLGIPHVKKPLYRIIYIYRKYRWHQPMVIRTTERSTQRDPAQGSAITPRRFSSCVDRISRGDVTLVGPGHSEYWWWWKWRKWWKWWWFTGGGGDDDDDDHDDEEENDDVDGGEDDDDDDDEEEEEGEEQY